MDFSYQVGQALVQGFEGLVECEAVIHSEVLLVAFK